MEKIKPMLFTSLKGYNKSQFVKDLISGVIVAIIALPLSIALALASGVGPEQGIYTAIVAGFVISFLGGSTVQIAGPTAAFATIVAGIVASEGMDGLAISTIMAGIFLVIMGLCRFGSLIKYIPNTITLGFTFGIAVTIVVGQIKDFCGMTFEGSPVETTEKIAEIAKSIDTFNPMALLIGVISLAILILWPKKLNKIPPSLVAVVVGAAIVKISGINVNTIGDLYTISSAPPSFTMPEITFERVKALVPKSVFPCAACKLLIVCVDVKAIDRIAQKLGERSLRPTAVSNVKQNIIRPNQTLKIRSQLPLLRREKLNVYQRFDRFNRIVKFAM